NRGLHDMIGVTGACLMVEKKKFAAAGGFFEGLAVAFNDVDLCYQLFEKGYYNVQDNRSIAYHHESFSRGLDTEDPAKIARMAKEYAVLMGRHPGMYNKDPFYHPFLIEDEHTSVFIFYQDGLPASGIMPLSPIRKEGDSLETIYPDAREDACFQLGAEYGGAYAYWEKGQSGQEGGYYVKGYSFIIGSDNACFSRKLLLWRQPEPGEAPEGKQVVYELPILDWYRPDIGAQTPDQLHTDMAGFKARIKEDGMEPGVYRIGMLAIDRTSRMRLRTFVPNYLEIGRIM
ncbi:MAG: hypothetical protein IJU50_11255, partial [Lachnospiraceae bacterium]|nr:hypothetical protein [Lachnospiraceae bacterium]